LPLARWMSRKYLWLKNSSAISLLLLAFSMHTDKITLLAAHISLLVTGKIELHSS
jgi:thiaminase